VNSDFKNGRVADVNNITTKQERAVKKFTKDYFDKAVIKHREHEKRRLEREGDSKNESHTPTDPIDDEVKLTDDEAEEAEIKRESVDSDLLKRKRALDVDNGTVKKVKMEDEEDMVSPAPPPPPPTDSPEQHEWNDGRGGIDEMEVA
jgi:[histone H3]-lysine36 N-trimethyltransferase